jgi:hypothetical protein
MKWIPLVLCLLLNMFSHAQDTIVQRNGTRFAAKVLEIDKTDIKYKKFENTEGPSYVMPVKEISMIRYKNGTVDTFNVADVIPQSRYVKQPLSEMYLKGQKDAETYYTNFKPAAKWTLGLTLPLNAIGIIPAVAFSATPPSKENLGCPDQSLLANQDYYNGYVARAKDKKGSKVMKSFGIGCLGSFLIYGSLLLLVK